MDAWVKFVQRNTKWVSPFPSSLTFLQLVKSWLGLELIRFMWSFASQDFAICGERSIKIKQTKTNLNPSCKFSDISFSVECQICYLKVQLEFILYPVLQLGEVEWICQTANEDFHWNKYCLNRHFNDFICYCKDRFVFQLFRGLVVT